MCRKPPFFTSTARSFSLPIWAVGASPERSVALPQPPYFAAGPPVVKVFFYRIVQIGRKFRALCAHARRARTLGVLLDRLQQLVEGVGKQLYTVFGQLVGCFLHRNSDGSQIGHCLARSGQILGETHARLAVIAEGF